MEKTGRKGTKGAKEVKDRTEHPGKGNTCLLLLIRIPGLGKEYAGRNGTKEAAPASMMGAVRMTIVRSDYPKPEKRNGREPNSTAKSRASTAEDKEARRAKEKGKISPGRAIQPAKAKVKAKERARILAERRVLKEKAKVKARKDPKAVPVVEKAEPIWTSRPRRTTPTRKVSACPGTLRGNAIEEKEDVISLIMKKGSIRQAITCSPCSLLRRIQVDLWDCH